MSKENNMDLVFTALRFAAEKHHNQKRKDTRQTPYINHPIEVVETLWRVGRVRDPMTLAGAILHDTVEDTPTSFEEIREVFGEEMESLVRELTDDKTLPKLERKRLQIEKAPYASLRAKQIKLADKICNFADLIQRPPVDWELERVQQYFEWGNRVVEGLRGCNFELEQFYFTIYKKGLEKYFLQS